MSLADDIAYVGSLLDAYSIDACRMDVAAEDPEDRGVPLEMQAGEVNEEGWVEWKLLPSTLQEEDVVALEREFGPEFRHCFGPICSHGSTCSTRSTANSMSN